MENEKSSMIFRHVSFNIIAFLSSDVCIHIFSGSVMMSLGSSFVDYIFRTSKPAAMVWAVVTRITKVFTSIGVVFTIVDYICPVELIPKVKNRVLQLYSLLQECSPLCVSHQQLEQDPLVIVALQTVWICRQCGFSRSWSLPMQRGWTMGF